MNFLNMPVEIRTKIYCIVFDQGKAVLGVDPREEVLSILPAASQLQHHVRRSSQLLRVCKSILSEARHILYSNTLFHVIVAQAFAGRLPCAFTDGHPAAPFAQHIIWQLDCDMMKHLYPEDLKLDATSVPNLATLELLVRAETWRDSFLGEWCDREAFVRGRESVIAYAKLLKDAMLSSRDTEVSLVEDRSQLGKGRVILRLSRGKVIANNEVS
jgi:hypothetical protein